MSGLSAVVSDHGGAQPHTLTAYMQDGSEEGFCVGHERQVALLHWLQTVGQIQGCLPQ